MANYRVSLGFAQLPDTELDDFAGAVISKSTGNAAFPSPPVTTVQLGTLKTAFEDALAAAAQGGTGATAAKNNARETLVSALRKNANYVETIASSDEAMLLSSGYASTSTNRAQSPLDKVNTIEVVNLQSGELRARIEAVANAKGFDGQIKPEGGDWGPSQSFANSRSIIFKDLTPGTLYTIRVRAIGGSTGQGDWSDPISHRAM
jgi:hypothetical protein